ncbi:MULTISPECIES: ATP-binding protein [unclassified Rathayibacter]|uniref:ATP-binding protein n=1 Tax=unclassified Rathayibacter TaxID=2609250 RepID=UPI000CE758B8|nr:MULTISPECIES: ATP-binding protein [unclassified Rathayibacter]PPG02129.1 ATP-binding protein [Rathayibacter sp. AY2B1]PPG66595.1 ATP-binding protein [Rathayibacter sp. AY1F4]PPH52635.1 ATP-binding protein [Rathayibacter sp. AY1E2]
MSNQFPSLNQMFGLEREKKIADSGVRNIFTPHQPIGESDLLFGRQTEVRSLIETLNTPGQHVLLYGERGVGKSSIANVASVLISGLIEAKVWTKRCDNSDTFESILKGPLAEVGADLTLVAVTEQDDKSGTLDAKVAKGTLAKSIVANYAASHSLSPSTVAEAIAHLEGLLIVDEADAIGNPEDRRKLAELIKLLSDSGSKLKVMIVGISETGEELTAAHPSVQRCLRETKLNRMSTAELTEIITTGGPKAGLNFTESLTKAIVRLSAGYPHFTHLIALKCAEEAVAADRTEIDEHHLKDALTTAVRDAEGTLKRDYEAATRSAGTDMYRNIVLAAASLDSEEFNAASLREAIDRITSGSISQGSLNNFLIRLVSDDGKSILTRTAKGVYRFTDPRMASYARMYNALAAL